MTQWGLDNLFNPGKRHMDDEKRRLQSTREEVGDNSGGRRIDLEAGTVSISVRRPTPPADTEPDAEPAALDPALDAEDVPAVALVSDEAEIEPGLDEGAAVEPAPADPTPVEPEPVVIAPVEPAAAVADQSTPDPEPVAPAAPRARRSSSASAWSRRG